jgi:signal peptidase II
VSGAPVRSNLAEPGGGSALPANRYWIFLGIAIGGSALDLLTKHWVFRWRGLPLTPRPDHEWWLWEGYVGIETALNRGALFGHGAGYGTFFAAFSVVAAVGICVWLFPYGAARDLLLTVALSCVTAGIVGNLYDRLGLWSTPDVPEDYRKAVRDWILLCYHQYKWPNFNVADSLLVCGAGLLMWHGFGRPQPPTGCDRSAQPTEVD